MADKSSRPSNKNCHHGGAVCYYSSRALVYQPSSPLGTSAEGVGQGRCSRVLPLEGSKGHRSTSDALAQQIKFCHVKSLLPRLVAAK